MFIAIVDFEDRRAPLGALCLPRTSRSFGAQSSIACPAINILLLRSKEIQLSKSHFLWKAVKTKTEQDYNRPYITWHLGPESLANFKSYVTIRLWADADTFDREVAKYFNDDKPLLPFEKYRRRRVIFSPVDWRTGMTKLPDEDSPGVK